MRAPRETPKGYRMPSKLATRASRARWWAPVARCRPRAWTCQSSFIQTNVDGATHARCGIPNSTSGGQQLNTPHRTCTPGCKGLQHAPPPPTLNFAQAFLCVAFNTSAGSGASCGPTGRRGLLGSFDAEGRSPLCYPPYPRCEHDETSLLALTPNSGGSVSEQEKKRREKNQELHQGRSSGSPAYFVGLG